MFANTNLFTVVKQTDYPDRDSIYFDQFWDEMKRYCLNGYSVGDTKITGKHFWYLNFWPIFGLATKDAVRKTITRPRFTELDYERWWHIDKMDKTFKNSLWFKARQNGSSETAAANIGFEWTFYPGSQNVVVAGMSDYSEKTMANVIRGLNALEETEFYKRRRPDKYDYVKAQYQEIVEDEHGNKRKKIGGIGSELYCLTAKDNPQALSRLSPSLTVFEECGMWSKGIVRETYGFVKPSLWAEGKKVGKIIFIGTGGEMGDSVEDIEYMFYNPDEFDLIPFDASLYEDDNAQSDKTAYFIPAWKYEVMDDEGGIKKEESIENILNERKRLKGKELYRYITQKPLKPSEGFLISSGGFFGEDIVSMLNDRRAEIIKSRELRDLAKKGEIYWVFKDGTKSKWLNKRFAEVDHTLFEPNEDGEFVIYEDPQKVNNEIPFGLYKGATDSYDRDEANTSKSKGSCYIRKSFLEIGKTSKMFVAELNTRPDKAEKFHEMTAKLCFHYGARNLIEYSNLTIFQWYENNGMEHMLRERPTLATAAYIIDSKANYRYGVDPSLKVYGLKMLADELKYKANIDKLFSLDQINAFIKFRLDPKYNCDITVASAYAIMHEKEEENLMVQINSTTTKEKRMHYVRDKSGNLKMVC